MKKYIPIVDNKDLKTIIDNCVNYRINSYIFLIVKLDLL